MHILPDLKRLERKYADSLVVIGVHSAKFFTEQETENIRQAILRYDIEHPVVNDNQMVVWQQYAVRAWPTLVLIDPSGKIVGYHSGEGIYEIFDRAIEGVIRTAEAKGTLKRGALNFRLERDKEPRTALRFPGKVLADERTNRLFIADSNHHRICGRLAEGQPRGDGYRRGHARLARWRVRRSAVQQPARDGVRPQRRRALHRRHRQPRDTQGGFAQAHGGDARGHGRAEPRLSPARGQRDARSRSTRRGTWCCSAIRSTSRWQARTSSGG
jgi:hypothetical protein